MDATFESSDGLWTDFTCEVKGRDFRTVLWTFEAYRLKHQKPSVSLLRVTSGTNRDPTLPADHIYNLKWKVPFAPSSGRAKHPLHGYTEEEKREIDVRLNAALAYWLTK